MYTGSSDRDHLIERLDVFVPQPNTAVTGGRSDARRVVGSVKRVAVSHIQPIRPSTPLYFLCVVPNGGMTMFLFATISRPSATSNGIILTIGRLAHDLVSFDGDHRSVRELDRLPANEVNDAQRLLLRHLHVVPVGRHPGRLGLLTFDDQAPPRGFEIPFVSAALCQNLPAPCRDSGREKNLVTAFVPKTVICDADDNVRETVGAAASVLSTRIFFQRVGRCADLRLMPSSTSRLSLNTIRETSRS